VMAKVAKKRKKKCQDGNEGDGSRGPAGQEKERVVLAEGGGCAVLKLKRSTGNVRNEAGNF